MAFILTFRSRAITALELNKYYGIPTQSIVYLLYVFLFVWLQLKQNGHSFYRVTFTSKDNSSLNNICTMMIV